MKLLNFSLLLKTCGLTRCVQLLIIGNYALGSTHHGCFGNSSADDKTMIDGQTTWSGNMMLLDIIDAAKIDKISNVENAFYKERLGYARTKC